MTDKVSSSRLLLVGRVLAPYGIKGWVKVEPFTESPESLRAFGEWRVGKGEPDESWRTVKVLESASHSGNVVARFPGCEDRDAALAYRGMGVAVSRSKLPETRQDEFYQADLIGLKVVNEKGEQLGEVSGVFSNGGHEVLRVRHEVDGKSGERLIPFVAAVVLGVDLASAVVSVDWESDW